MLEKTVAELSKALRSREVSSVELTQAYLEKIATVNERLNTYITTCDELALEQASKADQLIADGKQNPLLGTLLRVTFFVFQDTFFSGKTTARNATPRQLVPRP